MQRAAFIGSLFVFMSGAMPRLLESEKQAKGTARKCRALKPRSKKDINEEIKTIQQCLTDMQHNLVLAGQEIKQNGMYVEMEVTDNNGTLQKVKKINPAFKVQREALGALRGLKRHLQLLREEESAAGVKEQQANESNEFERPA
jgi:hypothetical protein